MFDPVFVLSRLLVRFTREVEAPHSIIALYDEGEGRYVVESTTGAGAGWGDACPSELEGVMTLSLQSTLPIVMTWTFGTTGLDPAGRWQHAIRTIAVATVRARGLPPYVLVLFFEVALSDVPAQLSERFHLLSERMGAILAELRPCPLMSLPMPGPTVNCFKVGKRYARTRRPKIQVPPTKGTVAGSRAT